MQKLSVSSNNLEIGFKYANECKQKTDSKSRTEKPFHSLQNVIAKDTPLESFYLLVPKVEENYRNSSLPVIACPAKLPIYQRQEHCRKTSAPVYSANSFISRSTAACGGCDRHCNPTLLSHPVSDGCAETNYHREDRHNAGHRKNCFAKVCNGKNATTPETTARDKKQVSRKSRILNWVEGKYKSQESEGQLIEIKESSVVKIGAQKHISNVELTTHKRHLGKRKLFTDKARKVSRSTSKRRKFRKTKREDDLACYSSYTNSQEYISTFVTTDEPTPTLSTRSNVRFHEIRLASLRDKLLSKGQTSLVIDLLEARQPMEALRISKEAHTRVSLDVCLLWSCLYGMAEVVGYFLENGASPDARDSDGNSALHFACESGIIETVQLLVQYGARLCGQTIWENKGKYTPLILASKHGYVDIVSLLLSEGIDPNSATNNYGQTALLYGVRSGSEDVVRVLLNAGATLNPIRLFSETPLHVAVEEGYSCIVELLLAAGGDVKASKGVNRMASLHIAAQGSFSHILIQLLTSGADPNVTDIRGRTPLHYACRSQCFDGVQVLLKYGANPNRRDDDGKSPIHFGIIKGAKNIDCLKLLLESESDPNTSDNSGHTPLHIAALNESSPIVNLLISYGADLSSRTNGGTSALNIIIRKTPTVLNSIHQNLDASISFYNSDKHLEREGQIKLDFQSLLSRNKGPECNLLCVFIDENLNSLIKHPLCQAFSYLKWVKVRSFFIINVVFYTVLVCLLTAFIELVFISSINSAENMPPSGTENNSTRNVTQTIWEFYQNFNFEKTCYPSTVYNLPLGFTLLHTTWIFLTVLSIKEAFQLFENPKIYFSSLDNVLLWPVIIGAFTISIATNYSQHICPWEFHVAALVILFGWLELLLLVGRFPLFGTYVQMFSRVTKNVGKFLITYVCLLAAFSCSFGILFHNHKPFSHRFLRILKTLVMMTGEVEYEEWFYEKSKILYGGTAHFVFAAFLLFCVVILMNLLVGLAVSDIQGLQKSAGLDKLIRQTQLIRDFENFMFSPWLRYLIPHKLLRYLHSIILLANENYGTSVRLSTNSIRGSILPPELLESAKKVARHRDRATWRRHTFANFKSLSTTSQVGIESDIDCTMDAVRCGLDILMWDMEDRQIAAKSVIEKLSRLESSVQDVTSEMAHLRSKMSAKKKTSRC